MRFRKKPVEVEALQWTGDNLDEMQEFVGMKNPFEQGFKSNWKDRLEHLPAYVWVEPSRAWVPVHLNEWVVKGVNGEFYPCDPVIFRATYEAVS